MIAGLRWLSGWRPCPHLVARWCCSGPVCQGAAATWRRRLSCSNARILQQRSLSASLTRNAISFSFPVPSAAAASEAQPIRLNRKLLQWSTNQHIAAARVSRAATKAAIENAVDNPSYGATRGATAVGQIGTTLTSTNPCALAWTWECAQAYNRRYGTTSFGNWLTNRN